MNVSLVRLPLLGLLCLALPACGTSRDTTSGDVPKVELVSVGAETVTITQPYVGRVHSHRRIQIRSPGIGVLGMPRPRGGDQVKQDDLLFTLSAAPMGNKPAPRNQEPVLIKAPFDGLLSRMLYQEGDVVQQGDVLTTLADNSEVWVYFGVPEARYLEYQAEHLEDHKEDFKVELVLANGDKFNQPGKLAVVTGVFDPKTGTVPFRADFPNPEGLLRHGQSGTVQVSQVLKDAIVIPQEATFEAERKRFVYVVDSDSVAHRREIVIENELENRFVVKSGLHVDDKIVVAGVRRVREGEKVKGDAPPANKREAERTSVGPKSRRSLGPPTPVPAPRGAWA